MISISIRCLLGNKWTKSNNLPEDMTDFQRMSMLPDADGQLRFSGRNKDREHFCNITTDLKEVSKLILETYKF